MTVTPFTFQKLTKTKRKARIALVGYEGSGKTMTALKIATRIAEVEGKRVALGDSEGGSAAIYADRFDVDGVDLPDGAPQTYVNLIKSAEAAGYGVMVIDSLSHEWIGAEGALEMKDRLSERSGDAGGFTAWAKVTPEHRKVFDAQIRSNMHVIVTMRQAKEYVVELNEKGKNTPRLIGTKPIQRDGSEYEYDLILTLQPKGTGSLATVAKSRFPNIAQGSEYENAGADLADRILAVLNEGEDAPELKYPVSTDELATIVKLGSSLDDAGKAAFYGMLLPSLGFPVVDKDRTHYKRFVREGGPHALKVVEWLRDQTAPKPSVVPDAADEGASGTGQDDAADTVDVGEPEPEIFELAVGQYLGTQNRIVALDWTGRAWKATDDTGAVYHSNVSAHKDGLTTGLAVGDDGRLTDQKQRRWPTVIPEKVRR